MPETRRSRHYTRLLNLYVAAVSAGGLGVLLVLAPAGLRVFQHAPLAAWLLVLGTIGGEEAATRVEAERQAERHALMLGIARGLVHRLQAQDHHKDEGLALVAHDLREPLLGIQRTASSLLDGGGERSAEQRDSHLAVILDYARHADQRAKALLLDVHHVDPVGADEGARFELRLPVAQRPALPPPPALPTPPVSPVPPVIPVPPVTPA